MALGLEMLLALLMGSASKLGLESEWVSAAWKLLARRLGVGLAWRTDVQSQSDLLGCGNRCVFVRIGLQRTK